MRDQRYNRERTPDLEWGNCLRYEFPSIQKGLYRYSLDGLVRVDRNRYQKHVKTEADLAPEELIYVKQGRVVSEFGKRRSGRTTRIINAAIAELVRDGQTILMDHHPLGHDFAYNDFRRQMKRLHPTVEFEVENNKEGRAKVIFITNA